MSTYLGMSEAVSLGIHSMLLLAKNPAEGLNLVAMANSLNASEAHLAKVMQRLRKSGMISALRGPGGGYKLLFPPENISLLQIYEAIDGPFKFEENHCRCPVSPCKINKLLHEMACHFFDYLKNNTLASVINESQKEVRQK
ncbi:MAG TPA: Rrf2 family transcriptional regulator [Candidatus Rifleibacterium sp.]|nr:Rrf2 family transcriptional regulator [Candidatus Rifleibacterium sp.]HPW57006.1 Rrf2 family transcriptional regulator [Candidatus Rifleibacterium sp.]HQB82349.1 Rrf2 family transcriptional regulator [Candidatus Rifleibacterium sp.]